MGDDSGYYDVIVTSERPSHVFRFPLSTGVLSKLKMATYFFVKRADQSELQSCYIDMRLVLFRFGYV